MFYAYKSFREIRTGGRGEQTEFQLSSLEGPNRRFDSVQGLASHLADVLPIDGAIYLVRGKLHKNINLGEVMDMPYLFAIHKERGVMVCNASSEQDDLVAIATHLKAILTSPREAQVASSG